MHRNTDKISTLGLSDGKFSPLFRSVIKMLVKLSTISSYRQKFVINHSGACVRCMQQAAACMNHVVSNMRLLMSIGNTF